MSRLTSLTQNVAETSPNAEDPRLRTRFYALSRETVWNTVYVLAAAQPGWDILEADQAEGVFEIESRTRFLNCVDDVTIRVRPASGQRISVDLLSRSRVGKGDLGTQARRIRHFLAALDNALSPTPR
ncbi:DUF1499 domain-containing protein [Hyalangium rubrum]|uniref:DUF1499 domain-containing protein n=1 Tax=Hyalangium rubrum TaxID=3103134 RepID=A0ABU5GZI6_9BACT|nr:DUF1499 domain-containing protein [Hyalangium sp. s54d21]MDY7226610.1 DUF1499 domain-containing protein [Hyalangium sp. s54d21]